MLNSLPLVTSNDGPGEEEHMGDSQRIRAAEEARLQRIERNKYYMARSFFDCKEYDRCAVTLMPSLLPQQPLDRSTVDQRSPMSKTKGKAKVMPSEPSLITTNEPEFGHISQRSLFLALYSKFMAGEKRKNEESEMILGPADGPATPNKELVTITSILEQYFKHREKKISQNRDSDGFLEYLYGIVLSRGRNEDLARDWLIRSVNTYAWNWSAWQELLTLIPSTEILEQVCRRLSPSLPAFIFQICCAQELYQSADVLHDKLEQIEQMFPTSAFLQIQRALMYYHSKEFDAAEAIFSSILNTHPYRLDNLDAYSNVLYVMDTGRPRLSYLANIATSTDRFRPETCCIVGNHYSKSSEHEKAVIYFRRALTLDRSFLSAWTLMGHEYIELKNTQAAIEAYRRAIDVNQKDFRAWHGLGLGYELLELHSYALYYYQRAAALQPNDPKMWAAIGASYDRCGKAENAIRAYKRALAIAVEDDVLDVNGNNVSTSTKNAMIAGSNDGADDPLAEYIGGRLDADILYQIAILYESLNDIEEAAAYMELCLAQEDDSNLDSGNITDGQSLGIGVTQTTSKARLWLARYAMSKYEWRTCMQLATELCQDGYEVEEAKGLIKDVRSRLGESDMSDII